MENDKLIPAPGSSLGNLLKGGVEAVRGVVLKASATHGHYFGQILQEEDVPQILRRPRDVSLPRDENKMGRGDTVYDRDRRQRGVIVRQLKAAADDGSNRYEIVDREGNSWKQKETRLKLK